MTYDFTRNYRGVKAPGAVFAVLMTLGVNAGLFAMLGWMNHRTQTSAPAHIINAHPVDLVHKLEPEPPPMKPIEPAPMRSKALHVKPLLPHPERRIIPRLPMPMPLSLPDVKAPYDGLPLVDNLTIPALDPQPEAGGKGESGPSIHDEDSLGQKPIRKHFVRPLYPLSARRMGLSGWVKVAFVVDADGNVTDARVVDSTGRGRFDTSAVRAVSRWQFKPGRQGDRDVAVRCEVTIEFNLEN